MDRYIKLLLFMFGFYSRQVKVMGALSPSDPSSFSRPEQVLIKHVEMQFNVDFEKKILNGGAIFTFEVLDYIEDVILDTSDLDIRSIRFVDGTPLNFKLDSPVPNYGSKLTITLPESVGPEQKLQIRIKYNTSPNATALQWLDSNQTSGKEHPYLFSQCGPIHARSILPCQDTPAVKFTYEAEVTAPEEFTVLMSAIREEENATWTKFSQPVPIPSYLLALAVGVLESRELVPRQVKVMGALSPSDPSSFSRPEQVLIKHVELHYDVDFDKKILSGGAIFTFEVLDYIEDVILDTSDLDIRSIRFVDGTPLNFKLDSPVPNYGSKLTITLPESVAPEQKLQIRIKYNTSPNATALQWLDSNQTSGKKHPYLFTQCGPIHARSILPCQDTPAVKFTYEAEVTAPEEFTVLMSAIREEENATWTKFSQPVPIPSYLLALAVGVLESRELGPRQVEVMGALSPLDPSSFSRPEQVLIKHVEMQFNVDFEKKILNGGAIFTFEVLDYIEDVILDTSDLDIRSIRFVDGTPLNFKLDSPVPNYGSKLTITLPESVAPEQKLQIRIKYNTSPNATALQWLDANQTAGKKHPYLFSQCEPIHARSILPCQDTPAVKFTYEAEVTAPEEFTVLMSAIREEENATWTKFSQPVPIPSYLLALAVGVLESRELGPRSQVWAEKEEIERSAWEFADTEKYLKAAEGLCGPYPWTQYDLLVLPPSFPYGGMENPCLTFVTPTLLAGDRSQADVIIHEIVHSWTGNLVTNKNFEHFWLNEGFTVFLERKVTASLITDVKEAGKSRDFESLLGLQDLSETINDHLGAENPLTKLVPDLDNTNPDDSSSRVPYEKGSLFLRYLEDLVGGPAIFDDFMRSYLNHFQRKSLDTDQFKEYLLNYFKDNEKLSQVDWETWLYKSGMPPIIPDYDTSMTKSVNILLDKINEPNASFEYVDIESFSPHQKIYLLQALIDQQPLALEKLRQLGKTYKIIESKNTEITYRWLRLCIRSKDEEKVDDALAFVNEQGRMKYVRPIYRDLYAWEEVRERAIENFLKNEPYMMHVSAYTLRKDLHLN